VHSPTFRFITPEMTEKFGISNPCTTCHKDKNAAWAKEAITGWRPNYPPWRTPP